MCSTSANFDQCSIQSLIKKVYIKIIIRQQRISNHAREFSLDQMPKITKPLTSQRLT